MTAKAQGALDRLADAARLEAARDAMRTAPSARRVGEEIMEAQVAALTTEREFIEIAVRKLCPLANNEGYEDEDGDVVVYRCINEDGDAFIDTESLAEAVEGMVASYDRVCSAFEAKCEEVHRLTAEVERLTKEKAEAVAIATDAANEIGKCCDSAGCDVQNWCSHAAPFRVRLAALSHRPPCLLAQAATE